jgi:hypothetical protein
MVRDMLQRMPPWALDDFIEEKFKEFPINRQGRLLSIHQAKVEGVQTSHILDDVWPCP